MKFNSKIDLKKTHGGTNFTENIIIPVFSVPP